MSVSRTPTAAEREYMRVLGERLRAIRTDRHLSLSDVERMSGGHWVPSVVGSYERGQRAVTLPRLKQLADFYGVSVHTLIPDDDTDAERARVRADALDDVIAGLRRQAGGERAKVRRGLEAAS